MTESEKASERLRLVNEAITFVRNCATQDRKLTSDNKMSGRYTRALQELESLRANTESIVKRTNI